MANKRKKKHWWQNIKFKYKLTVINENTLEEVFGLYVSKLNGLSVLLGVLFVLFLVTSLLMVYTPLRNYLPGYMSNELRSTIVTNALKVDSLEQVAEQQHRYVQNIQDLLAGRVELDSVQTMTDIDSLREMPVDMLEDASEREELFRMQYEEDERYNLVGSRRNSTEMGDRKMHRPTRGIIASVFDVDNQHYGVDIAAVPNSSVLAVLDGTVLWSGYSMEAGYVIAIQHKKGLVSVYMHCNSLLKKQGQSVKAGEAVGLVGNKGVHTVGPHLHFELWSDGEPLNPEQYIVF
ncbi:MAG: M23 family metallopeptidase [Bacteroidaceae bacterium]|nr:M23 family metallopeptidase [Bacteroidaceae bacterium]